MQSLKTSINQSRTLKYGCVLIPLGSPTRCPKVLFWHAGGVPVRWSSRAVRWVRAGGYYRVGIQGGYREGLYRGTTQLLEEGPRYSRRRAPEALQGLEWVVPGSRTYWGRCRSVPPSGPGRYPCRVPPCTDPPLCRLLANKGEIRRHFLET